MALHQAEPGRGAMPLARRRIIRRGHCASSQGTRPRGATLRPARPGHLTECCSHSAPTHLVKRLCVLCRVHRCQLHVRVGRGSNELRLACRGEGRGRAHNHGIRGSGAEAAMGPHRQSRRCVCVQHQCGAELGRRHNGHQRLKRQTAAGCGVSVGQLPACLAATCARPTAPPAEPPQVAGQGQEQTQ